MTDPKNMTDAELRAQLEALLAGPQDPFTADPFMTTHLLATMIHAAGGEVEFTQAMIDEVDGLAMGISFNEATGTLTVTVEPKKVA